MRLQERKKYEHNNDASNSNMFAVTDEFDQLTGIELNSFDFSEFHCVAKQVSNVFITEKKPD